MINYYIKEYSLINILMSISQTNNNSFSSILLLVLNNNNEIRKKAELELNSKIKSNYVEAIVNLTTILLSQEEQPSIKQVSCSILSNLFKSPIIQTIWLSFNAQQKEEFKQVLLKSYLINNNTLVKNNLADFIVVICEFLYDLEMEEQWEDLISYIKQQLKDDNSNHMFSDNIESIYYLLVKLYTLYRKNFDDSIDLLIQSFSKNYNTSSNNGLSIKTKINETISEMFLTLNKNNKKRFNVFLDKILLTTAECLKLNNESLLKRNLLVIQTLGGNSNQIHHYFNDIIILMKNINSSDMIENNNKELAFNTILAIAQKKPSLIKKDEDKLQCLLSEMISFALISIDNEMNNDFSLLSFFDIETIHEEELNSVCLIIDDLYDAVGFDCVAGVLNSIILQLINSSDKDSWKKKYVGFILLSKLFTQVSDISIIENIIPRILEEMNYLNSSNTSTMSSVDVVIKNKILFSCLECLLNLSNKFTSDFHSVYFETIFPLIVSQITMIINSIKLNSAMINENSCLLILLQSLYLIIKFLENSSNTSSDKEKDGSTSTNTNINLSSNSTTNFSLLIKSTLEIFNISNISVRELIIELYKSVFEKTGISVLKEHINTIFSELITYLDKIYNQNIDLNLLSLVITFITLIGPYCDDYLKYFKTIITCLLNIQNKNSDSKDVIFNSLKEPWFNILPIVNKNYSELIPLIFESLMKLMINIPTTINSNKINRYNNSQVFNAFNSDTDINNNFLNYENAEFITTIEIFNCLIEESGSYLLSSFNAIEEHVYALLDVSYDSSIKKEASNVFVNLAKILYKQKSANKNDNEEIKMKIINYITKLFNQVEVESEFSVISLMLDNISTIITEYINTNNTNNNIQDYEDNKDTELFSSLELQQLTNKLISLFNKINNLRKIYKEKKKLIDAENNEEDDEYNKEFNNDIDNDIEDEDEEFLSLNDSFNEELEALEDVVFSISDLIKSIIKSHKNNNSENLESLITKYLPSLINDDTIKNKTEFVFEITFGVNMINDLIEVLGCSLKQSYLDFFVKRLFDLLVINDSDIIDYSLDGVSKYIGIVYDYEKREFINRNNNNSTSECYDYIVSTISNNGFVELINERIVFIGNRLTNNNSNGNGDKEKLDDVDSVKESLSIFIRKIVEVYIKLMISSSSKNEMISSYISSWMKCLFTLVPYNDNDNKEVENMMVFNLVVFDFKNNSLIFKDEENVFSFIYFCLSIYKSKMIYRESDVFISEFIRVLVKDNIDKVKGYYKISSKDSLVKKLNEIYSS